ncbi:CYTH domain-containing protein [Candidatus Avelusimicrobium fimicolum]|uniref:CYTH domain-containing protein n=1 Tax=Candidatus Avelusimicrobium fimicolum TaxID=3416216 RepID=UPI003D0A504F
MPNIETEFKWDSNSPRAFARVLSAVRQVPSVRLSSPRVLHICDTYLDTPEHFFEQNKIAFRVRNTDGVWEATYKTRTEVKNGRAVRREESLPLPGIKNLAQALSFLADKKKWDKLPLTGLKMLFALRNKRTSYDILFNGVEAELSLDNFMICVCGRRVLMKEAELELKKGQPDTFDGLARQITQASGLAYARVSKVKTATALLTLWGE